MQSLKKIAPPLVPFLFSLFSVLVSMVGMFPPSYAVAQNSYSAIKNAGGKCMDVQNGYVSKDGTLIQIWDCNNTTAQQWQISGETIRNAGGKCLDIQSGAIFNEGQPVWLYGCNNTNAQRWIVTSSGEIRNPVSNKCLDVKNGWIGTSGTPLQIYSCNGTPAQKWSAVSNSVTSFRISYTSSQRANSVVNDAVNTWMSKIQIGPQGSPVQNGFTVNIVEQSSGIGYADGVYASSGTGTITVYPAFFNLSYGKQKKVIMHEMGHVMGFGQQRSTQYMNLVRCGSNLTNCYLAGNNITANYGGSAPLQGNFFSNSRPAVRTDGYFHFAEGDSKLARDLMSAATLEDYSDNDLKYTISALKDMGFIFK